jgi:hypothetical protein
MAKKKAVCDVSTSSHNSVRRTLSKAGKANEQNGDLVVILNPSGDSFACNKKIKCQYCETFFVSKKDDLVFEESNEIPTSFITAKNRGGLQYPSYDVVRCFSIIYIIVTKLISGEYEKDFLALNQHKNVIAKLGLPILENQDIFLGHQCSKHNKTLIFKHIVSCSVNTLFK